MSLVKLLRTIILSDEFKANFWHRKRIRNLYNGIKKIDWIDDYLNYSPQYHTNRLTEKDIKNFIENLGKIREEKQKELKEKSND